MQSNTILIVDDMPFDRQLLTSMITKLGYSCIVCDDGKEALALLKEQRPAIDLVLLDLGMPGIDGISTLGHCKAHYADLPVIIVTVSEDPDEIEQTIRWGADALIQKPVDMSKLKEALEKTLKSVSARKASN